MIDTAVILAAGYGSRLRGVSNGLPKPLVPLVGVPLIIRIMNTAQKAGIRRFVVVTGYEAEQIRVAVSDSPAIDADIEFVHNAHFHDKANGVSVLSASEAVNEPFALLMGDHIFEADVLRRMLNQPLGEDECVLAIDRKIDEVFDLDDATKVVDHNGHISEIEKDLVDFNAVDTGMFACTPALFDRLRVAYDENGDCSLSDGIRGLARERRMRTFDIGKAVWQDVDTPQMRKEAARRLGESLRKPTDGPVSRMLNRRISIPISRVLSRLHVSPNQISAFNLVIGLITGVLFASSEHVMIAIGGILFQFGSIVDGCDGEVARLTYRQSDYGQWVDTVTDNISYVAFLIGLIVGQFRRVPSMSTAILGVIAVASILTALLIMYQRINAMGKGSLLDFKIPSPDAVVAFDARLFKLYENLRTFVRRDVFALGVCVMAVLNLPGLVFAFWVAGCIGMLGAILHITSGRVQRQLHIPVAVVREPVEA